ncbi:hypothetical protein ACOSQ2_000022 [Xanthoceras sorbifolium]
MAAAEGLVDFRISSSSPSVDKKKSVDDKKGKNKDWKKRADGKKKKESESFIGKDQNQNKSKTQGCFICNGPHLARDCPKKEKINALISQDAGDSNGARPSRVNPLQLLNTISTEPQSSCCKGLMYVIAQINGRDVRAMLDTGARGRQIRVKFVRQYLSDQGSKLWCYAGAWCSRNNIEVGIVAGKL